MTIVSETTLPLKNAIKDILLKIKNNETAMATSAIGLGVAGAALSFPLFRYVGFDSLGGGTAFLVSTAISTVSAITALMGVYKLSSIAINKLSQALDPIADRIDDSVKNFKERLNGFWSGFIPSYFYNKEKVKAYYEEVKNEAWFKATLDFLKRKDKLDRIKLLLS